MTRYRVNKYKWKWFTLIIKGICPNYNLNGVGDLRRAFIPAGYGNREEMSPASVRGDPHENRFPDEEFPVVVPTLVLSFKLSMQLHVKQWTETQNEKYLASFMTHHLLPRKKRACHPQASASLSAFSWKKLLSALTDWVLDLRLWGKCRIASIPFVHIVLPLIYPPLFTGFNSGSIGFVHLPRPCIWIFYKKKLSVQEQDAGYPSSH